MWGFDNPWFRPLWRRLLIVGLVLGWGIFELVTGAPFWAVVFLGIGALAAWGLLLDYPSGKVG